MSVSFEFYDTRAREAAEDAQKANLVNVKERHLRAEKTWRALAEQAHRAMLDREQSERERAARREAEEKQAHL